MVCGTVRRMESGLKGRKIIHVDMDAFYASVEQRDNPSLKGKPVVVGGSPQSRGVVASCSYEARKFGIRSAISCAQAARLCPQAVFVSPDFSKYSAASRTIREIFHEFTDLVEPLSLDEAYLDVTENKINEPIASKIAKRIRELIKERLNLTASAGVGPNKFIAKLASDFRKPDGLVIVPPDKVMEFVDRLPVERLWGVGPATAKRLHEAGFKTTADIRAVSKEKIEGLLGSIGPFLHDLSHGIDHRVVDPSMESKSIGSETTFDRDISDPDRLSVILRELAEDIVKHLKKEQRPAKTITLKLRYEDFSTITRSKTLSRYTDDVEIITSTAEKLLRENTDIGSRSARLIGISVSKLWNESEPEQLWLDFPPPFFY